MLFAYLLQVLAVIILSWFAYKIFWFLFFVVSFAYRIWQGKTQFDKFRETMQKQSQRRQHTGSSENMIQCEYCSVYIPESKACVQQGKSFCSLSHAEKYYSDS